MQSQHILIPGTIGVDIGGTFTDLVYYTPPEGEMFVSNSGGSGVEEGSGHSLGDYMPYGRPPCLNIYKVPSTPSDPVQGLLAGMHALHAEPDCVVIHGSTVATNALLERKGAHAALVTTEGFADVLEIGRQNRPALYDLLQQRPPVLIPRERRLELPERLDHHGSVLRSPTPAELEALIQQLLTCQPESIAISLLYAFRNPVHEQALAAALRDRFPTAYLSLSSELLPQFREYERTSTVAVNAYVQPLMARYLNNLQTHINGPLRIMQSSGGSISATTAAHEPVRTVFSGPAGGVIGGFHTAHLAGHDHIITLDMGGTSTDVSLCAGTIPETSEAIVAGCPIGIPTIAIHTVGAGGGSIARLDEGGALTVGPDSAGALPGPACYRHNGPLTVTDANLILGRISPTHFLGGRFTLYPEHAQQRMAELAQRMQVSVQEAALGIIRVVNASMERALRAVSLEQGYDPRLFTLLPFGGAGPLHACELAEALHISHVLIPRYPGILSALGMLLAPIVKDYVQTVMLDAHSHDPIALEAAFALLETRAHADLQRELAFVPPSGDGKALPLRTGVIDDAPSPLHNHPLTLVHIGDPKGLPPQEPSSQITNASPLVSFQRSYDLRYLGQSYELTTPDAGSLPGTLANFHALHQQRFGHSHPEQPVQIVAVRLKTLIQLDQPQLPTYPLEGPSAEHALLGECLMTFTSGELPARLYERVRLRHGNRIQGPALLIQDDSTILLPPGWEGVVDAWGNIEASSSLVPEGKPGPIPPSTSNPSPTRPCWDNTVVYSRGVSLPAPWERRGLAETDIDPVSLEIFKHLFSSIAEEMGVTLGRTAYSPNIKERKDYSCACFDAQGRLIAQAAHIPVHLGAMPASVRAAIDTFHSFEPGDIVMLNDPYLGGTHLPDITLVSPVFIADDPDGQTGELFGFVASRAHHADVGGMAPGSMPMSRELYQEGIIIPPIKVARRGIINQEVLQLFYRNVRTPRERRGDMDAQLAAARVGEGRLHDIIARYGSHTVRAYAAALLAYSAQLTRTALALLLDGEVVYTDYLDDDGWGTTSLPITVRLRIDSGTMIVDFSGSAPQSVGCVNAALAVTHSAVLYVVRCLVGERVPANQGCLEPVTISVPQGSLLNPLAPAAVAAGNVETSQRIVDTLFGALAQLAPDKIPAASQGTMNNLTLGGYSAERREIFAYYETMGGGMGARPGADGLSGVHVHMSNTRNTPIEALEIELPVRVHRYALRYNSGGAGRYRGGDGLCRELYFLAPASVTLLTERRTRAPYGLHGGEPGAKGTNLLEREGIVTELPAKVSLDVQIGDVLRICTPGGGGFLPQEKTNAK